MPKLNNFMINNFKIFEGEHWFSFKDLNVFSGANNSGKSAFLQLIYLIQDAFKDSGFPIIDLTKGIYKSSFQELKNRNSSKQEFGFGFSFKTEDNPDLFIARYRFIDGTEYNFNNYALFHSLIVSHDEKEIISIFREYEDEQFSEFYKSPLDSQNPGLIKFKINIEYFQKNIEKFSKNDYSQLFNFFEEEFNNVWWGELFTESEYHKYLKTTDFINLILVDNNYNLGNYKFRNRTLFRPFNYDDNKNVRQKELDGYYENKLFIRFDRFISSTIKPIIDQIYQRIHQLLTEVLSINKTENIASKLISSNRNNDYLLKVLRLKKEYSSNDQGGPEDFITSCLDIFKFKATLDITMYLDSGFEIKMIPISKIEKQEVISIGSNKFTLPYNKYNRDLKNSKNIIEFGKGTQTLFLLILKMAAAIYNEELLKEKPFNEVNLNEEIDTTILIEEPETYLHPAWQSKLADLFVFCKKNYHVQFVIETHSEYLVRKLQYLTAKKEIKPADSVIYYFHDPNKLPTGEEQVKKLEILEDGSLTGDFGPGFFDEATNLKFDLLKLKNPQKN